MFEISKNARRLLESEKKQYKDEGYITGLPVFSEKAKEDLHNFIDSLNINDEVKKELKIITPYNYTGTA